jgi:hypothetical protein
MFEQSGYVNQSFPKDVLPLARDSMKGARLKSLDPAQNMGKIPLNPFFPPLGRECPAFGGAEGDQRLGMGINSTGLPS